MRCRCCHITLTTISLILLVAAQGLPQDSRAFDYDFGRESAGAARIDVDNPDPDILRQVFAARRQRVGGGHADLLGRACATEKAGVPGAGQREP